MGRRSFTRSRRGYSEGVWSACTRGATIMVVVVVVVDGGGGVSLGLGEVIARGVGYL